MMEKSCPACSKSIAAYLAICPYCGADVRQRCPTCRLPFSGEPPCCGFGDECRKGNGQLTHDEAKVCTPRRGRGTGLRAARLTKGRMIA